MREEEVLVNAAVITKKLHKHWPLTHHYHKCKSKAKCIVFHETHVRKWSWRLAFMNWEHHLITVC